jgi:hypothetical protein
MTHRYKCLQCANICEEGDILQAPNPFDATDTLHGCPSCKSVDVMVLVCDVEGCNKEATSGWPSSKGYRQTCGDHYEHEK